MAGFREFLTGEVLTAANVNSFLMKQSVMVFADAAARTAALGAEVAEGMLTYNEDTGQLEVFDGSAFVLAAPAPPAGIGSNVVSTAKTDTFTTSSATFTTVTGLTATITPTTNTSKVLVIVQLAFGMSNGIGFGHFKITGGNTSAYVGASPATRVAAVFGGFSNSSMISALMPGSIVFLDSPATTSATTYAVEVRIAAGGFVIVNRSENDADNVNSTRGASSITVIEVAA